jgi:zinc transport system substrate-binding protein
MGFRAVLLAAGLLSANAAFPAFAGSPEVMASIKPIHSLVARVMEGVGEPGIIVDGAASPHTYSLKPSDAARLEEAEVVFWVGEALEPFLAKTIETLGGGATVVELSEADGLTLLPVREGGTFDDHDHEAHGPAGEHEQGEGAHVEPDEQEDEKHAHDGMDLHLWLDPQNGKILLGAIAAALSAADPANAERYTANAETAVADIDSLQAEIAAELGPVKDQPFVVFHDAYQYFEKRFGLNAAGTITVSPEVAPGARRIREIRDKITELGAVCVFAEPQFEPRIIETVIEETNARSGVLDPEGAEIANGPELYPALLGNLAKSLKDCLSATK